MKASCPLSSPQRLFPSPRSGEDPSQSSLKGRGLEVSKEACPRFPSPRRGGGRGGECKLTSQSFNCFTPPLTPPLKREGKGPLNAVILFTPPLTPPLKREGKGSLNAVSLFTPPLTPPLKREGKGSCKGGERMLRTGCFRTHLVPLFHLPYDTRFYAAWSIGRFSVECKPILRGV